MHERPSRGELARIGGFELDVAAAELRRSGRLVALTGQPMRVLIRLVERGGSIVTREELQREIWGPDTHVDFDAGLSTCINQIRTALGDRAASPRFVETLPRRGYRFVAPVEWSSTATPPAAPHQPAAANALLPASGLKSILHSTGARSFAVTAVVALSGWFVGMPLLRSPVPTALVVVEYCSTRPDLQPVSRSLTDAMIGALASEAGDRARVASPIALQALRDKPFDPSMAAGFDYVVLVTLRPLGGPVLVHVKLVDRGGWVRWTSDREMTFEELERAPLRLAAELSRPLIRGMVPVPPQN